MIHLTPPDRVASILAHGLQTGREPELTTDAIWTVGYYGVNPVFLAREDCEFIQALRDGPWEGHAILDVDVEGLELVADLASLVDRGARHDEDGYLFWPPSRLPDALRPFADQDGALEIEFLLDPTSDVCMTAIHLTGTSACLSPIPAARLTLRALALSPIPREGP